jgi:hypothetical protein
LTTAVAGDASVGVVLDALADRTRRATLELLRRQPVMAARPGTCDCCVRRG